MKNYSYKELQKLDKRLNKKMSFETKTKIRIGIQIAIFTYIAVFFFWLVLFMGCLIEENPKQYYRSSCSDNELTKMVIKTHKPFIDFLLK